MLKKLLLMAMLVFATYVADTPQSSLRAAGTDCDIVQAQVEENGMTFIDGGECPNNPPWRTFGVVYPGGSNYGYCCGYGDYCPEPEPIFPIGPC